MAVFKIERHVPDVYPRKSRDFQLLCRLFDCVNDGVKFDIDSIKGITDTNLCNERLLNLLQTKLGFFTSHPISSRSQRIILKAFPYLLKYKGSTYGIKQAINVFLKTQDINSNYKIEVHNDSGALSNVYVIKILIEAKSIDVTLLNDLLTYIIPAGYSVDYSFYTKSNLVSNIDISDENKIKIIFVKEKLISRLQDVVKGNSSIGVVGASLVASTLDEAKSTSENPVKFVDTSEGEYTKHSSLAEFMSSDNLYSYYDNSEEESNE